MASRRYITNSFYKILETLPSICHEYPTLDSQSIKDVYYNLNKDSSKTRELIFELYGVKSPKMEIKKEENTMKNINNDINNLTYQNNNEVIQKEIKTNFTELSTGQEKDPPKKKKRRKRNQKKKYKLVKEDDEAEELVYFNTKESQINEKKKENKILIEKNTEQIIKYSNSLDNIINQISEISIQEKEEILKIMKNELDDKWDKFDIQSFEKSYQRKEMIDDMVIFFNKRKKYKNLFLKKFKLNKKLIF